MKISVEQRFLSHVNKTSSQTGCWEWTAYKISNGYGQFGYNSKMQYAHRVSYELFKGPIPKGLHCLHTCDNPKCVCPSHLFLGTYQQNMDDRNSKNRQAKGENHGASKLTESQVLEIRNSTLSQKELTDLYHVTKQTISYIKNKKTWKHIS